ncbi:MAG: tRNA (5-methylaminomethyl-2-thiouridine)(34)-methyltransferase MnmD, partial [Gammaproteobacteria bacterium]
MTIEPAQLQFDDRGLPRSTRFNDVYYSDASAVAESNAVFVDCARQHPRWQTMSAHTPFTIAELGFGFGLNFLLSARAWLQQQSSLPTPLLHYLAFEKYPPAAAALQRVHALWPDLAELAADLRRDYPRCGHGCHRILLRPGVILDLYLGDAAGQLARRIPRPVDCWYLDGFAPGGNPELWDSQVLALVAGSSHGNTRLCSYSVAGKLRRELSSEGFTVTKLPGFGRKRHRLLAQFDLGAAAKPASLYLPANLTPQSTGTATIVGAGLAGCAVAASLARRGWRITIVDGCADSGIPIAGIGKLSLGLRIFREDSAAARFYLLAYLHALGVYRQLASSGRLRWHESGLIQLSNALNRKHGQADLPRLYDPSLLRAQTQHELSDIAGLALG